MAYEPLDPPQTAELAALAAWAFRELQRISITIRAVELGHLDKSYAAPVRPRDGDIRYADGTTWNPGTGAGIYWYNGTTWTKL